MKKFTPTKYTHLETVAADNNAPKPPQKPIQSSGSDNENPRFVKVRKAYKKPTSKVQIAAPTQTQLTHDTKQNIVTEPIDYHIDNTR